MQHKLTEPVVEIDITGEKFAPLVVLLRRAIQLE